VSSDSTTPSGRRQALPVGRRLGRRFAGRPLLLALVLIAPALGLRLMTGLWPFVDTVWLSLHRSNPTLGPEVWIGFANYRHLLSDLGVRETIFFTVLYTVASTIAQVILGMAIALLLGAKFRLRRVARTLNLIPWAIPVVVTGIAFRFALDSDSGLFAHLIAQTTGIHVDWLLHVWPARISIIATNVWRNAPFVAIILLAALQAVPEELYEAGRIDGGSRPQLFRKITLPLVTPVLISIGVFLLIFQIATFDLVLAMTGGGPGNATQVLGYQAYLEGFQGLNFGTSAALSIILFAFVALFGLLGVAMMRRAEARL
jgi:multiple sugar transport system permease protein